MKSSNHPDDFFYLPLTYEQIKEEEAIKLFCQTTQPKRKQRESVSDIFLQPEKEKVGY